MAKRKTPDGLPENLYRRQQSGGWYYQYRDTRTGKYHGLGYDRKTAVSQAKQLNSLIAAQTVEQRVQKIMEQGRRKAYEIDWHTALQKYWTSITERQKNGDLSAGTVRSRKSHIKALASLPNWELAETPYPQMLEDTNKLLKHYQDTGKDRTAQAVRSAMIDVFTELRAQGYWTKQLDPATATRNPKAQVKRMRLTLDHLNTILDHIRTASRFDPWLEHAILLAVTTSHCNAELSRLTYTERGTGCFIADDHLHIARQKIKNSRVRIPLDFGLTAIGYSLREIIEKTRRDKITTTHVIHHQRSTTKTKPGDPVHPNTYSRRFRDALKQCNITPPEGMTPPTFYELRSLSERLGKIQGVDVQTLMGHKQARMTAIYDDLRGGYRDLEL